jgi:hypothetical protein
LLHSSQHRESVAAARDLAVDAQDPILDLRRAVQDALDVERLCHLRRQDLPIPEIKTAVEFVAGQQVLRSLAAHADRPGALTHLL